MLGHHSTRTLAALPATLLLATLLAPTSANAVGETCRGVAATIVHTSGNVQYGTAGRDVIVTNGGQVITGGGDDLVCVTDGPGSWSLVESGPGDDVVDTTLRTKSTSADLDEGSDQFFGGPGSDDVSTGDVHAADVDMVSTGTSPADSPDSVYSGHVGLVNHDVITTDSGRVVFGGTPGAGTKITGGPTATLSYHAPSFVTSDLDAAAHVWRIDQRPPLQFTGFAHFELQANAASTHVRYRGTQDEDSFWLWIAPGHNRLPTLDVACRSRVDGRAGRDTLTAFVEVYGDRFYPEVVQCAHRPAILLGGRGADVLTGNYGNDRLFGGRGSDSATGRKGRDVCSAERTRSCEVRR